MYSLSVNVGTSIYSHTERDDYYELTRRDYLPQLHTLMDEEKITVGNDDNIFCGSVDLQNKQIFVGTILLRASNYAWFKFIHTILVFINFRKLWYGIAKKLENEIFIQQNVKKMTTFDKAKHRI